MIIYSYMETWLSNLIKLTMFISCRIFINNIDSLFNRVYFDDEWISLFKNNLVIIDKQIEVQWHLNNKDESWMTNEIND